jgi:nitrate/nitrite-specific signal transduction histidine kinase
MRSQKKTLTHAYSLIFGLTSILPILLFVHVLLQYGLIVEAGVVRILGLSFIVAGLGYLFSMRIVRQVSSLAADLVKVEIGELGALPESETVRQFAEMDRIADAFNRTLVELRDHSHDLERLVEKLSALSGLTEHVSRTPNIKEALETVLHRTMAAVNAQIGSIMLLDDESQRLRTAASEGLDEAVVAGAITRAGESIAAEVVQTGEAVLVQDIDQDSRFQQANCPEYESYSFVSMPLQTQWKIMGALSLSKRGGEIFGESDLEFLAVLLWNIGFALENTRLREEAKYPPVKLEQVIARQSLQLAEVKRAALESTDLILEAQKIINRHFRGRTLPMPSTGLSQP